MAFKAKLNVKNLDRWLNGGSGQVQPFLKNLAHQIEHQARINAPKDTGRLEQSIHARLNRRLSLNRGVVIVANAPYARYVHEGTGPQHRPEPRPNYYPKLRRRGLILWSENKRLNPYAVAAGIAANGTPAVPFLSDAVNKVVEDTPGLTWIKKLP